MKREPLQILFRDATDFPGTGDIGPPTSAQNSLIRVVGNPAMYQIDMTSLANAGGARQAVKAFLPAIPSGKWSVDACIEFVAAPTDGDLVFFYWAQSPSVTAANGNAGGTTGTDAAFTETVGNLGQMRLIGTLSCIAVDGAWPNASLGNVGILIPTTPYGNLVVLNQAIAQTFHTVMDETHIVFTEILE